jgi:flagellar capping protein FliD
VVVVGIASLTNKGSSSACTASLDAAKAAATVHYANSATYPATLAAMTTTNPPELVLPTGVTVVTPFMKTTGASWTLTMTVAGTATTPPTLVCTVP